MSIEPIQRSQLLSRLNMILWGESKAGKTTYAMSAPGKKLIINFDPDGFTSVMHREDFDVIDLSIYTGKECIENAKRVATYIRDNHAQYNTIIIDSLTTLVHQALVCAVENGIGKSSKFNPSLETPGLSAWGARNSYANDVVQRILRISSKENLHCIMIAHTDDPEYADDGKTIIRQTMMLSAKIKNNMALRTSEIWNMTIGSKRMIYTAPFGVKEPMGSRMFDTSKVPKFELNYNLDDPDDAQPCSISSIFERWKSGDHKKLTSPPQ